MTGTRKEPGTVSTSLRSASVDQTRKQQVWNHHIIALTKNMFMLVFSRKNVLKVFPLVMNTYGRNVKILG